ncbi:MAG TPA: tripartite tricarboxylate transporter substrate binding protein [Xanthobacteraceae bacterium]|nr:tripartite tricarboxylate transporter substrate binding protein [Xanthobacteraceae bacterium]
MFIHGLAIIAALITLVQHGPAAADEYPSRPLTLIAPWPAGGAVDTLCRIFAARLTDRLGKSVVVDNRPGAGSVLGVAATARATPDGYTLVMAGSAALATTVTIYRKLLYDPSKDFAPLALITRIPFVLVVNPSLPVNSVTDLIKLAKNEPGRLSYASGGPGSPHHLFTELFKSMTGIEMLHVPYKGSAPALNDVVAGQVPLTLGDVVATLPLVSAGKVRALGVSSSTRIPSAPDIPTIAESGVPGYEGVGWVMIVAPAHTPGAVVERLYAELKSIAALPEVREQMIALGTIPVDSPPPDAQQRFIDAEVVRWSKVVKLAGIAGTQ